MTTYINTSSVPLSLAVFLATDNYDHDEDTISTTKLIKPLRQVILGSRVPTENTGIDLTQMMASRMGTAVHDGIEAAWKNGYAKAMKALNYPDKVIERIRINPTPAELTDGVIPIYMEQRSYKKVGKYTISGKFDFVGEGRVEDFKTTSVYTAINHSNDEKYILQGSIYRWLNPEIITRDEMAIQFIFTDWSAAKARVDPAYPQMKFQQLVLPLMSIEATDRYVKQKLADFDKYWDFPDENIPLCSDEDLWRSDPVFKYYKNPDKMSRSTKNFSTQGEAYVRLAEDGNVGIVVESPGQVTACKYCSAFSVCSQKDILIAKGDLVI